MLEWCEVHKSSCVCVCVHVHMCLCVCVCVSPCHLEVEGLSLRLKCSTRHRRHVYFSASGQKKEAVTQCSEEENRSLFFKSSINIQSEHERSWTLKTFNLWIYQTGGSHSLCFPFSPGYDLVLKASYRSFTHVNIVSWFQKPQKGLLTATPRDGPPFMQEAPAVMEMLTPAVLNRVKPGQVKAPGTFLHVNTWSKFRIILWWCRTLWLRRRSKIWTTPNLNIVRLKTTTLNAHVNTLKLL